MRIKLAEHIGPFLNRAHQGSALASEIFGAWESETVRLDFDGVAYMSVSFANALFFNLLRRCKDSVPELKRRIEIENASDAVRNAINLAVTRHVDEGMRLSRYVDA